MFRNKVVLDAALGFGASKTLSRMQGHGWVLGQKHATLLKNLCFRREESEPALKRQERPKFAEEP